MKEKKEEAIHQITRDHKAMQDKTEAGAQEDHDQDQE
jgi:hypothetical protein